MKQFKLVQVGNSGFRQPCLPYSKEEILGAAVREDVARLKYTMAESHGVGLAGPQVGIQRQVFVLRLRPTKFRPSLRKIRPYAVFNPKIISVSKENEADWEGCFSVAKAGLFAEVTRPSSIRVSYLNEKAEFIERTLEGLEARIFQHENDHLTGKIFLEREANLSTLMGAAEYKAMRQNELKTKS